MDKHFTLSPVSLSKLISRELTEQATHGLTHINMPRMKNDMSSLTILMLCTIMTLLMSGRERRMESTDLGLLEELEGKLAPFKVSTL